MNTKQAFEIHPRLIYIYIYIYIYINNIWHLHSFGSYNVYLNDTRISYIYIYINYR